MYLSEFHRFNQCRVFLSMVIVLLPHIHYGILSPMDFGQGKRGIYKVLVLNPIPSFVPFTYSTYDDIEIGIHLSPPLKRVINAGE